ncbi:MAG: TIGR01777 family oxidoreductase [Bacteroides sp.]|jgi:uncharacterized protein (TIGR01777 family)|nr:TIGR01777 family oxidoreductase [Bacteroides sp.]MCI1681844.1 TIGR01777 family oxidoreductase [Bacteroides sp.]
MKIAISGATGYIGGHLCEYFAKQKHEIVPLQRALFYHNAIDSLTRRLEGCAVVINLAGASINKRWTAGYKQEMYNSRIDVTRQLVQAIKTTQNKPQLFISTSAVGYYSSEGTHDEYNGTKGEGFLSDLCQDWEKAATECPQEVRTAIIRLGVVFSTNGGALQQMLRPLILTRISAIIGHGKQPFPWIGIQDLCRAIDYIIGHKELRGSINLTVPQHTNQKQLAHTLARAYGALFTFPIPRIFFRILYGERASFITDGQTVRPSKLLDSGFEYSFPTIESLLNITDHETVNELDVQRYMGKWYEIARYENKFEKEISKATATYTLQPGGYIKVENAGYRNGVLQRAVGRAKQPDKADPGKLKVTFFLWFYADYYILELDKENYNYALVGSSSDKYLWILSRTPQLSEEVLGHLLQKIERRGYDTGKLLFRQ